MRLIIRINRYIYRRCPAEKRRPGFINRNFSEGWSYQPKLQWRLVLSTETSVKVGLPKL